MGGPPTMALNAARIFLRNVVGRRASRSTTVKRTPVFRFSTRNVEARFPLEPKLLSPQSYQWNSAADYPVMPCFGGILALLGFGKAEEEEDPITKTIKRGILALQKKEYNKAEKILHLALKMSQDGLDENAVTYCYDVLANIAYERGDYPKAEKMFVETMKRMILTGTSTDDNAIIEMSLKIAIMNGREKHHEKAEQGYRFCIETQRQKVRGLSMTDELSSNDKDSFLLLGLAMDYFADYLVQRARYAEARQMWSNALEIAQTILGHAHEQTLVVSSNLATAYQRLGKIPESIEILEKIVSMKEVEDSVDLPIFLCNLGMNYIAQRNYVQAENVLERAKLMANKLRDGVILQEVNELLDLIRERKNMPKN